jgi:sugar phosphate isomerase/epimerase
VSTVSFSTMWAQQERFADLGYFREVVAGFGFDAIEVSHVTDEDGLRRLLTRGTIPLSSLHAPTPHRWLEDGRHNGEANVASLDEAQRAMALAETQVTIDFAADAGLRYVVVHLGGVGDRRSQLERELRELYLGGQREGEVWDKARGKLRLWRAENVAPHLEAARHSLDQLVEYAAPKGVALGLESRLNYHEFPHPDEALELLEGYPNEAAGFWYDTGHCAVQSRLGMLDWDEWLPRLSGRMIGTHLHDVDGLLDHRAPGNGSLDWKMVQSVIPTRALRVLEIDQHEPDDLVADAREFLRERAIV